MHVSPSQVDTYIHCPRKWAWDKIGNVPRPANRFAVLGTQVHHVGEHWLKHGTGFDPTSRIGRIYLPAAKWLGERGVLPMARGVEAERAVDDRIIDAGGVSVPWTYRIDITVQTEASVLIYDYKTCSTLNYCKTAEELTGFDPQGLIYGWDGLQIADGRDVGLGWLYLPTNQAHAHKVHPVLARVDPQQNAEGVALLNRIAAEMIRLRLTVTDPMAVPCEPTHCTAYGGCPYTGICKLTTEENIMALSPAKSSSQILAEMRAKHGAGAVTQAPAATQPPSEADRQAAALPPGGPVPSGVQVTPPASMASLAARQAAQQRAAELIATSQALREAEQPVVITGQGVIDVVEVPLVEPSQVELPPVEVVQQAATPPADWTPPAPAPRRSRRTTENVAQPSTVAVSPSLPNAVEPSSDACTPAKAPVSKAAFVGVFIRRVAEARDMREASVGYTLATADLAWAALVELGQVV